MVSSAPRRALFRPAFTSFSSISIPACWSTTSTTCLARSSRLSALAARYMAILSSADRAAVYVAMMPAMLLPGQAVYVLTQLWSSCRSDDAETLDCREPLGEPE